MADHVLLIGMMGAGKTTVGRRLADQLHARYLDSDEQICRKTGRTVREIFESDGEAAFRRLESEALADAVDGDERSVVSVAGGAVLDPANQALIASAGTVVWLRAPIDVLAARVRSGGHRPLLDGDVEQQLERLYEQREPIYSALADIVLDVADRSPDDAAAAIAEALS